MSTLHETTTAFLAEARNPATLGHDDAMLALRPVTAVLNLVSAQAGQYRARLDDANLFETLPEARAFFEEFFQTVGAIQRITAEVQERARFLAVAEKQFDSVRDRMIAALEATGVPVPPAGASGA